jgi:hypothetical protein
MIEYFTFSLSFAPRSLGQVADDSESWAIPFSCVVTANYASGRNIKAGEGSGWIIPRFIGEQANDMWSAADAQSGGCEALVSAILDGDTGEIRDELECYYNEDILCIDQIKILPCFRGRNVGLSLCWHILDMLGRRCAITVIYPHPINPKTEPTYNPYRLTPLDKMSNQELEDAQAALAKHWSKLGFAPVPNRPGFYYRNTEIALPDPPEVRVDD